MYESLLENKLIKQQRDLINTVREYVRNIETSLNDFRADGFITVPKNSNKT